MGEGQETSERPASFHEHRAMWLILNGLIKSPSNPSVDIIMYSILRNIQTSNDDKYQRRRKWLELEPLDIFKLPILMFEVKPEGS